MTEKILMAWSGGKDSAMALHELRQTGRREVVALLTTCTEDYDRISMHGVRRALLEAQADSLGLPLEIVWIPRDASNEAYEQRMGALLERMKEAGVSGVAFGDLFLEDLRRYRQSQLARAGLSAHFPVWRRDTRRFAEAFIRLGFKARLVCVDTRKMDAGFAGRAFDESLLEDLPTAVDPCGENGEFHSFVHDGPLFSRLIPCTGGETVVREGYAFHDLLPNNPQPIAPIQGDKQ